MDTMRITGIYKIYSAIHPDKFYVGSALDIQRRMTVHKSELKHRNHPNNKLQNYFNKHGVVNFSYDVIERCTSKNLLEREQYYIDALNPYFNIVKVVKSPMLGLKHTEEAKIKIGKASLGRRGALGYKYSKEAIERIRKNSMRPCKEETKRKIGLANKGRRMDAKYVEQNRQNRIEYYKTHKSIRIGVPVTEDVKEKIRKSHLGKVMSEETKRKMSFTHTGKRLRGIEVVCSETGVIFKSIQLAADSVGLSQTHLTKMLRGETKNKTTLKIYCNG